MRIRYLPRLVIDRDALSEAVGKRVPAGDGPLRVVDVDEDNATLAVEAVRALLTRADLSVEDVATIRIAGTDEPHHARLVGAAVLGAPQRAVLASEATPGDRDGIHVGVNVQAVRPSAPALFQGDSSFADAFLDGSQDAAPAPHEPAAMHELVAEPDRLDTLTRVQAAALDTTPMGAYVPPATWAASDDVRYRPQLGVCGDGHARFPPRPACPTCGKPAESRRFVTNGRVHTFTVISGGGPTEFDFLHQAWGSYASLAVAPEDHGDARIPALAADVDPEQISIGQPVEPVFRRIYAMQGAWRYGTKFRPNRES